MNRRWLIVAAHATLVSCVLTTALQVQAREPRPPLPSRDDDAVLTIQGQLEIQKLELMSGQTGFQFMMDGKEVGTDSGYGSMSIQASYPEKGAARIVLLSALTGGSGCLGFFKVMEFKETGEITLSDEFGNCAPLAWSSFKNGVLRIDIPYIGGAPAESWRYQNGELTRLKRGPSK